mmetsp:Transcript_13117/g.18125  ORF Transcript_13117/g.18125 Transcript_13117/m.18125 type:complete len:338 (-) Transcript_13117:285-1298(-)
MSKTRVFVSQNGDYEGTPAIVIVKDGMSFEDFLAKAAQKLKVEKKFSRCFYITNGAEVDDPDDLMPEDKVFVSEGEDFKSKASAGMLSGGLSAVAGGASSLYSAVSGFAKSKMSEDMKKQFEDAENKVSEKMQPVMEKVKEVSAPAVGWADKKLEVAADAMSEKKKEFLASDTAKYLKENVVEPFDEKIAKPAAAQAKNLYGMASTELQKMREKKEDDSTKDVKDKNKGAEEKGFSLSEYMKNVKDKMGKQWDEKYAPAVKKLYEQAKEQGRQTKDAFQVQQEKLKSAWQEQVEPILREKLGKKESTAEVEAKQGDVAENAPLIQEPTGDDDNDDPN